MGLAILPPRLKAELAEVAQYLLGNDNNIALKHQTWANALKQSEVINANNVTHIVQQSVGQIFSRVLEDAGVFKNDQSGQDGLEKFIKQIEVGE